MSKLLTIGELAEHCGVTVRAIRHYHQRGLLAEPSRDGSGYRRYDARAVVDLVRIKVLADGGVPLAEIRRLLAATPDEFAGAIAGIDAALKAQVDQLKHRRRQLAGLVAGDRLVLPEDLAGLLDELRAMGVSERGVEIERDGWILMEALCPELVPEWTRQKAVALADEEFRRLYLECDAAREWNADDPRLVQLAGWMTEWSANRQGAVVGDDRNRLDDPRVVVASELMTAQLAAAFPAWRRLSELSRVDHEPTARFGLDAAAGSS